MGQGVGHRSVHVVRDAYLSAHHVWARQARPRAIHARALVPADRGHRVRVGVVHRRAAAVPAGADAQRGHHECVPFQPSLWWRG